MDLLISLSIISNIALAILLYKAKKKPPKQEDYDVRMLLHDLTAGAALIRVERVSPADVLIRTNRARRE